MRSPVLATAAVAFVAGAAVAQAQSSLNPGVDVENQSTSPITELQIRPEAAPNWGQNKLGGGPLAPGKSMSIREETETNCNYQIRAVYQGGRTEQKPVDVCRHEHVVFNGGE